MAIYRRTLQSAIEASLFKGKLIILYGARQVGKTTLVQEILRSYHAPSLYLNCDEPDIRLSLTERNSTELGALIGRKRLVVIDEAQRVRDIGLTLKLLVDNFPEHQFIAIGSSAFELSNHIREPLTGRKIEYYLYPLSTAELLAQETPLEARRLLEQRMRYGMYPSVIASDDPARAIREIATSYLYRDVLEYQSVRNPDVLQKLVQALALQSGCEVSTTELASLLGIDKVTVMRYITLLEQAYIIFQLPPFSRNLRKELGKMRKIYFFDVGIRNALINNLNPMELRQDVGALWENMFISERLKYNHNNQRFVNTYFWRTYDQAEIDYLEEEAGKLTAFECKWRSERWRPPIAFTRAYPDADVLLVNQHNYLGYLADTVS